MYLVSKLLEEVANVLFVSTATGAVFFIQHGGKQCFKYILKHCQECFTSWLSKMPLSEIDNSNLAASSYLQFLVSLAC